MTPISTKMSINHGPHCSVLEERSPRDCLHVHKDTNEETKQQGCKRNIVANPLRKPNHPSLKMKII